MILLDTNVLSALMLVRPEARVVAWLDEQPRQSVWTTAITVFEVRVGLQTMADGKRRRALIAAFDHLLAQTLEMRVAEFDTEAAGQAATLAAVGQRRGRVVDMRDTMIAGIVLARRAKLATRNEKHFQQIAASVVNPWTV